MECLHCHGDGKSPGTPLSCAAPLLALTESMLKCKVIPVDKLSAGLMRKCVISQLFKSFFPRLGWCFFITAALQTTSLEGWFPFLWVIL